MDLSAACLPGCKSRVFVPGDVRVEQVVHYSLRYATVETLFQSSRKESQIKKNPFPPTSRIRGIRKSDIDGFSVY